MLVNLEKKEYYSNSITEYCFIATQSDLIGYSRTAINHYE